MKSYYNSIIHQKHIISLIVFVWVINIQSYCQISFFEGSDQWLPQTYSTFHWISTEPGRWEPDYIYPIHYLPDGRVKTYFQLGGTTGDTLFKTNYDYTSNDLTLSQETVTTYQYGGENNWIPVSLVQTKKNIHNDIVESAHFTWSNSFAWAQQNGVFYDYVYDNNNRIIRIIMQEYSDEINQYINSEREVYYYQEENLITWLFQKWDNTRSVWKHKERIDAQIDNTSNLPKQLTFSSFQDSVWVTTSARTEISWHSYSDFIKNFEYQSFNLLYPYNGQLQQFYKYNYEYLNNSIVKTGMKFQDSTWNYSSRLTESYDSYGNPLEIHNEKWDQEWYTTYWIRTNYSWNDDILEEQYTERFNISTTAWENTSRIVYSNHSMTSLSAENGYEGVSLYPNPAKDKIKLEFSWPDPTIEEAKIYTITGAPVHLCGRITPGAEIRVEDLQPGMYILRIRCGPPTFHTSGLKFLKLPY